VALLGDHQEQQPIDQAQKLAVVIQRGQRPGGDLLAQCLVTRVLQEARAEPLECRLHAIAQSPSRTRPPCSIAC
jgi:hypothetical protein